MTPYRRLAAAVIQRAVIDARTASLPPARRRQAIAWLHGSPGLSFWAGVAGLDPETVTEAARRTVGDADAEEP